MKKIILHPDVFLIEDFFSSKECDDFLEFANKSVFEKAKINMNGRQVTFLGARNNDRLMFFDNDLEKRLWERIKGFAPKEKGKYEVIGLNEMFRIYKYSKGQTFRMHVDGSYQRNDKECSFYSFLIYLNDDFEGGETEFKNLFTVEPKKGMALVFHHPLRHEGKILKSGLKFVLRTDIMYKLK